MIFINVTALVPGRKAVGITRILAEVVRASKSRENVVLVAIDVETRQPFRLLPGETEALLAGGLAQMASSATSIMPSPMKAFRRVAPSLVWRAFLNRMPFNPLAANRRVDFRPGDTLVEIGLPLNPKRDFQLIHAAQRAGCRFLFYIHDLIPVHSPQFTSEETVKRFRRYLDCALRPESTVVVNSEHTRLDVQGFLSEAGLEVASLSTVIPAFELPAAVGHSEPSEVVRPWLKQPFILCVGSIETRKNHIVLYQALKHLLEQGIHHLPPLLLVGQRGWLADGLLRVLDAEPELGKRIVCLHSISDADLNLLYKHCLFTVYPSYTEGWGLPVSESLAHGKVVLTTNGGSLPEAAMGCAEFISPFDPVEWGRRMLEYSQNGGPRQEAEARIRETFKPRRWSDFSKELWEQIDACASAPVVESATGKGREPNGEEVRFSTAVEA